MDDVVALQLSKVGRSWQEMGSMTAISTSSLVEGLAPSSSPKTSIRLDTLVAQQTGLSRRLARRLIAEGRVKIKGHVCRILSKSFSTAVALDIDIKSKPAQPLQSQPEKPKHHKQVELSILYEDPWLIAVHKPAGLLSGSDGFGAPAVETLLPEQLRLRNNEVRRCNKLWLVHRLDAATSGVLIMARKPRSAALLSEAFATKTIKKTYLACCLGDYQGKTILEGPIARLFGTKHHVNEENGKAATTYVQILWHERGYSVLRLSPLTGRTHQLRVHLSHQGYPILGDRLYGGSMWLELSAGDIKEAIPRMMLHAHTLQLTHPKTLEPLLLEAPIPEEFLAVCDRLGCCLSQEVELHPPL